MIHIIRLPKHNHRWVKPGIKFYPKDELNNTDLKIILPWQTIHIVWEKKGKIKMEDNSEAKISSDNEKTSDKLVTKNSIVEEINPEEITPEEVRDYLIFRKRLLCNQCQTYYQKDDENSKEARCKGCRERKVWDKALEFVDKQISKEPKKMNKWILRVASGQEYVIDCACPNCSMPFVNEIVPEYCAHCGQKLKESDDKDDKVKDDKGDNKNG